MSTIPDNVAKPLKARQCALAKAFIPEKEEEEDDEIEPVRAPDEVVPVLFLSEKNNKLQSQLTTVEQFINSTQFVATRSDNGSDEATSLCDASTSSNSNGHLPHAGTTDTHILYQ